MMILVLLYLCLGQAFGLTCNCDDGPQCKGNKCTATRNWFGPEHCQLQYDPTVNGDKAWRGCNLANSYCDIISEPRSVQITITEGKLSSFGGCCNMDQCDTKFLEPQLNELKNASCQSLAQNRSEDFSCTCDAQDMVTLFDLSVERGIQWMSGFGNRTNASNVFDTSTRLRSRMSEFCTDNTCNANAMINAGITVPADSFPVCAHLTRKIDGKSIRGCTFVPTSTKRGTQSRFPPNPIAGKYDFRLGINASDQYQFIFECRSEKCNDAQYYQQVLTQCAPNIQLPTGPGQGGEGTEVTPASGTDTPIGTGTAPTGNETESTGSNLPATPTPVPAGNETNTDHVVQHEATTAKPKPSGGSVRNQMFHLLCILPVIVLMKF